MENKNNEITIKRKMTFWMVELFQFLWGASFYILYAIRREFIVIPTFFLPLFVVLHVYYIRGIRALKEDRVKTTRYTIVRWLLFSFCIISLILGVMMK